MTLVTDATKQLYRHVDDLEALDLVTENEAGRLRDRINALEGDIQDTFDDDPEIDDGE